MTHLNIDLFADLTTSGHLTNIYSAVFLLWDEYTLSFTKVICATRVKTTRYQVSFNSTSCKSDELLLGSFTFYVLNVVMQKVVPLTVICSRLSKYLVWKHQR